MRKKSHVLLARYLADQMPEAYGLQCHRKAFCLGNILPDIKPSFLTERHEFDGTFPEVRTRIQELTMLPCLEKVNERVYWRRLGEVLHYIADYFTFPHNRTYKGSLYEHNKYEKQLKNNLKSYICSGQAQIHAPEIRDFDTVQDLLDFIGEIHGEYLRKERNVWEDIQYILDVCSQVVQGVFQLYTRAVRTADGRLILAT